MAMADLPRVVLIHGPTPIVKHPALDAMLSVDLWIKRDDATGGPEAGNKVRKLELLLGDARARSANVVITCGGLQSNHARATALACASLGMACVLLLRVDDPARTKLPATGNVLLDRLAGAEVRLISRAEYAQRASLLESVASELRVLGKRPYVIPEGGSNGLGALGYVSGMRETSQQMRAGLAGGAAPFDVVVHACGSGGTAAGVALGAAQYGVAKALRAMAVCDDAGYFDRTIARIVAETRAWDASLGDPVPWVADDGAKGPKRMPCRPRAPRNDPQCCPRQRDRARPCVHRQGDASAYGKPCRARGHYPRRGARVLFLHTGGGLPRLLLAMGDAFEAARSH